MKEKLWRDMFIAHIFGVDMPEDIEVRRLSDIIKRGISGKEFSPALASLLILYGGGYIDDDAFIRIMRYLQADMLKDCGINHFDEWAADFGEVKTDYDYNL